MFSHVERVFEIDRDFPRRSLQVYQDSFTPVGRSTRTAENRIVCARVEDTLVNDETVVLSRGVAIDK